MLHIDTARVRTLVVDDSEAVRDGLSLLLERAPDAVAGRDARTVWALLRGLHGSPGGLTVEALAGRAVLRVAIAVRHLQRMAAREPALVAPAGGEGSQRTYLLTGAGHREIARLERRVPAAHAHAPPQLLL